MPGRQTNLVAGVDPQLRERRSDHSRSYDSDAHDALPCGGSTENAIVPIRWVWQTTHSGRPLPGASPRPRFTSDRQHWRRRRGATLQCRSDARVRLSESVERELVVNYERTIYRALREVSDALASCRKKRREPTTCCRSVYCAA